MDEEEARQMARLQALLAMQTEMIEWLSREVDEQWLQMQTTEARLAESERRLRKLARRAAAVELRPLRVTFSDS